MFSIGLKSGLKADLYLEPNTEARSKLLFNSCTIKCLSLFKSKYETLEKLEIY